jgi:hypothetical protein
MDGSAITRYGNKIELDVTTDVTRLMEWINTFNWVKYNPRKDVDRWGLSVTSLDGGLSGVPDLDSLLEYNKENGTAYTEKDFDKPTAVLNDQISNLLAPWSGHYYRTHFLKFGPGGFFPPHRDWNGPYKNPDSFRLIMPLQNVNPPYFNFVMEDKLLHWDIGRMYFIDTQKMHYLFNAGFKDSYWLVVNVALNETTVRETLERLNQK